MATPGGPWSFAATSGLLIESMPASVVVSRVLPVPLDDSIDALAAWRTAAAGRPLFGLGRHHLWLSQAPATNDHSSRVRAFIRRAAWAPGLPVELELSSWSDSRTEIDLRPSGRRERRLARHPDDTGDTGHRSRRYYALANAVLDYVAAELLGRTVGTCPSTVQAHGRCK
jgi:hypothetical protein